MVFKVKVEGMKSVEEGLFKLKPSTAKSVTKRGMKKSLEPMREMAEDLAPKKTLELSDSIKISSKVTRAHRGDQKSDVEMYMGPGAGTKGVVQEFGSIDQDGTPYMRPAWDAKHRSTLSSFVDFMRGAVKKSVARHEAKLKRQHGIK